jgi:maleylpyruvate isomerase
MRSLADVREWMGSGTRLLLHAVDGLSDKDFAAETRLPGWTRAHLVAHLHYNAEALLRLVSWARTGEPTPMYASVEARNDEIQAGSRLSPGELRELVHDSAARLASELDALPESAWQAEVKTAQGRTVAATEIPWMRTREVTVHAIDLGTGIGFADLPEALNAALATDAVAKRAGQGHAAALAQWLTGRAEYAPKLGPWL